MLNSCAVLPRDWSFQVTTQVEMQFSCSRTGDCPRFETPQSSIAVALLHGIVVADGVGMTTTLAEIMTTGVQTIRPGAPAATARERMRLKGFHHLLVKEGTDLVGVVSARDLRRGARTGTPAKRVVVADFMTPHIVTVAPETSVHKAANLMRGHSIGCLIVVDSGQAVGIVTLADLLDQIGEARRHRRNGAPPSLHYRVPHRKQHRTGGAW